MTMTQPISVRAKADRRLPVSVGAECVEMSAHSTRQIFLLTCTPSRIRVRTNFCKRD